MTVRPLLSETVGVPEAIVRVLAEAGVRFVIGMPGGRTIPIWNALHTAGGAIRPVLVREEGLAAVMADVVGRLTGVPAVAMGQAAFMLTNSGMGIVEAYLAGSPMLVLSDLSDGSPFSHHAPYQSGTGDYGSWDARRVISGYTKETFVAREPAQAVQDTQLAIKHSLAGQPGPVAVLYHSEALMQRVGPDTVPRLYETPAYLNKERVRASSKSVATAGEILTEARRPVIIAGNGVRMSQAQGALVGLAERLGIPVATSGSGKGVFPETHPLALGVFGNFGLEAANSVVAEADVVLAVGTKLGPSDTTNENPSLLDPSRQRFIQIEVEPRHASWTIPADVILLGDARAVLEQVRQEADSRGLSTGAGEQRVADAHEVHASFDVRESFSDAVPILPQRLIKDLHETAPADSIITCDAGENRLFMMHHFKTRAGMEYLQPAAVGGMGYAIPAAMAAKLVHPERAAIAICGDGGFGIALNGLMSAVQERIPMVNVVFNNSALGWVYHGQGERKVASELRPFDHAAIARAMGCQAWRVEQPDDFGPTMAAAMACGEPAVVDVVTSLEYTFKDVSSALSMYPAQPVGR
ncbi:MAG TPA: thiamine pyrophosphate-binding protein [Chloroflexota bacterium]|jgi:acetolactate synthase-1/2/3 large subunit|nr:thiamine pyrophosphate-binding protein [Chloroflexota bacterium]